ncbi:hypothetical protein K1X12_07815 [Hyphomonas sp. WL0036]|uniref:hypothetical protein n=1 Tax=Hyphomonas sediminis TaxID=2866160 RepID=UPI001C811C0A|nr:hypothetical protein [Hyphomonas sediminis]MBY9066803.1 hypothetical protein [Hyphomonas sediminis]
MKQGFTFERALSYPFSAPHLGSFPWMFALSYALAFLALFAVIGLLGWRDFAGWIAMMETVSGQASEPSPEEAFSMILGAMGPLFLWGVVGGLAGWVLWAMFEAASQRRYIWGKGFSLGFGGDELRLMGVGFLWWLMSAVIFALPILAMLSMFSVFLDGSFTELSEDEVSARLMGPAMLAPLLMLLCFPVYVFMATRLSPCFGLTVKEKRVRFFDAWNVSRGRFWPILGAFVILSIGGWVISQVVMGIVQAVMMPALLSMPTGDAVSGAEVTAFFTSPGFLVPMGLLYFLMFMVQGLMQHVVGAPAALAARHDPRNDLDDVERVDIFS